MTMRLMTNRTMTMTRDSGEVLRTKKGHVDVQGRAVGQRNGDQDVYGGRIVEAGGQGSVWDTDIQHQQR